MAGPRGRFITFEGGEGAGKSTQLLRLANWLESKGVALLTTREPGGTPQGEALRDLLVTGDRDRWDPRCEALLNFAARRCHLTQRILPALEQGVWVLSDRFIDSTMAYQGYAQGLGRAAIEELAAAALGDLPVWARRPDLTLLFDLASIEGLARAESRESAENRYETMAGGFHERVREGFRAIAAAEPERCRVIDASPDAEIVAEAARKIVERHLGSDLP